MDPLFKKRPEVKGPVLGLGTGRCGTRSFAKLLKEWGMPASHEKYRLMWLPDKKQLWFLVRYLRADVAFYWLNYVDLVLEKCPDAKFICLKRPKKDTLDSYMRGNFNPYMFKKVEGNPEKFKEVTYFRDYVSQEDLEYTDADTRKWVLENWDMPQTLWGGDLPKLFPQYDSEDKEECLSLYWDDYYKKAAEWEQIYPNSFMVIDMHEALNTENGRNKILNFIGICPNTQVQ
jgi:hypothetical protein